MYVGFSLRRSFNIASVLVLLVRVPSLQPDTSSLFSLLVSMVLGLSDGESDGESGGGGCCGGGGGINSGASSECLLVSGLRVRI